MKKKRVLVLLFTAAIAGVIPVSAYANSTAQTESNEIITNHEMIEETGEDGTISQVGLVSYEAPTGATEKAGCSTGNHGNIVDSKAKDTTLLHSETHPGYCTMRTTAYWRCTLCNTPGHDDEYTLVWCTGSDIAGDTKAAE